jgi:hypothetical protein
MWALVHSTQLYVNLCTLLLGRVFINAERTEHGETLSEDVVMSFDFGICFGS